MSNFFNWHFWFNLRPGALSYNSVLIMGTIIILLAALFTFLKIMKDRGYNAKMWFRLSDFAFTNALLACLLLFLTSEIVPFFSARFWFLLWWLEMIGWLWLIFNKKQKSKLAAREAAFSREQKKYLP